MKKKVDFSKSMKNLKIKPILDLIGNYLVIRDKNLIFHLFLYIANKLIIILIVIYFNYILIYWQNGIYR